MRHAGYEENQEGQCSHCYRLYWCDWCGCWFCILVASILLTATVVLCTYEFSSTASRYSQIVLQYSKLFIEKTTAVQEDVI
jgi:hypothetical protein